jgi:hypothetical protein
MLGSRLGGLDWAHGQQRAQPWLVVVIYAFSSAKIAEDHLF